MLRHDALELHLFSSGKHALTCWPERDSSPTTSRRLVSKERKRSGFSSKIASPRGLSELFTAASAARGLLNASTWNDGILESGTVRALSPLHQVQARGVVIAGAFIGVHVGPACSATHRPNRSPLPGRLDDREFRH